jgi:hypothetical protein
MPYITELATGLINGTNRVFSMSVDYATGSVQVWWNGLAGVKDDVVVGWIELGGNQIRLEQAPQLGDVIQIGYRPI